METSRLESGGPLDFLISPASKKSFENHSKIVCFELETGPAATSVLFSYFATARAGTVRDFLH